MQASPSRLLAAAVAFALGFAGRAAAQATSPFLPAPGSDPAVAAPVENIEFSGVVIGKKTLIILYDKTAKKPRHIPLGDTIDGISVLAYDASRDQVVVKVGGEQKLLTLRKATGIANAGTPAPPALNPAMNFNVPAPVDVVQKIQPPPPSSAPAVAETPVVAAPAVNPAKPEAPATPPTIAKQEEEARMLVSDLLEIGMAQRKAYEEKQKQAASGEQSAASTPPPPPAAQPAPNNGG